MLGDSPVTEGSLCSCPPWVAWALRTAISQGLSTQGGRGSSMGPGALLDSMGFGE